MHYVSDKKCLFNIYNKKPTICLKYEMLAASFCLFTCLCLQEQQLPHAGSSLLSDRWTFFFQSFNQDNRLKKHV